MNKIPQFIAVDIGSTSIKLCQSSVFGSEAKLDFLSTKAYPSEINPLDETAEGRKNFAEFIKNTLYSLKVKTKNAVVALPEEKVYSRILTTPAMNEDEVHEAIPWALKSLIPVPLENVNISFIKVSSYEKDGLEYQEWYTVAAPISIVEDYVNLFEMAGLNLLAIETEVISITRSQVFGLNLKENVLIVDIGDNVTNLIIAKNTGPYFSQSFSTAGSSFTKAISQDYKIDSATADKYKFAFGLDNTKGEGKIYRTLSPVADLIVNEIIRINNYYQEKLKGNRLEKILITGGTSSLPKIQEYIFEKVNVKTESISPLHFFKDSSEKLKIETGMNTAVFNVVTGLSIKGIDNSF